MKPDKEDRPQMIKEIQRLSSRSKRNNESTILEGNLKTGNVNTSAYSSPAGNTPSNQNGKSSFGKFTDCIGTAGTFVAVVEFVLLLLYLFLSLIFDLPFPEKIIDKDDLFSSTNLTFLFVYIIPTAIVTLWFYYEDD